MKITDLKNYTVVGGSSALSVPQEQKSTGQKILDTATSVSNFFGGKGIADLAGATMAKATVPQEQKKYVEFPSAKQVAGSALQLGANFIPGAGVGAGLGTKIAVGLGTGYALDVGSKLQQDKTLGETITPGIGTAVGGGLPIAGAAITPVKNILSRLVKGLGSGVSGVSTESIDRIIANPEYAKQVSQKIAKEGGDAVLTENAKTILNGVSRIKNEARKAFGTGLQELKQVDIAPTTFKNSVKTVLDKYGSQLVKGERKLTNVEFNDPKNIAKASSLINKLNTVKLDGTTLRKLADDIESAKYKIATSDERLSFNAFINDLASSLKTAVVQSTPKLQEINKAFSNDMQLAQTVENIFGKVNFKNLPEVVKASQKLETIFNQKGLAPSVVDDFLNRIGVKPAEFKTSEAVRQIEGKVQGANAKGLSIGEIMQQVTSSVITPKAVEQLSIATGLAKEKVVPFLNALQPSLRNVVIQALLQAQQGR